MTPMFAYVLHAPGGRESSATHVRSLLPRARKAGGLRRNPRDPIRRCDATAETPNDTDASGTPCQRQSEHHRDVPDLDAFPGSKEVPIFMDSKAREDPGVPRPSHAGRTDLSSKSATIGHLVTIVARASESTNTRKPRTRHAHLTH